MQLKTNMMEKTLFKNNRRIMIAALCFIFETINVSAYYTAEPMFDIDTVKKQLPSHHISQALEVYGGKVSFFDKSIGIFSKTQKRKNRTNKLITSFSLMREDPNDYIQSSFYAETDQQRFSDLVNGKDYHSQRIIPKISAERGPQNNEALESYNRLGYSNDSVFEILREGSEQGNLTSIHNLGVLNSRYNC